MMMITTVEPFSFMIDFLYFHCYLLQWIDSSYMASVNFRAQRVKRWWNETLDYLKSAGIRGRSDSEKRSCEIFRDIRCDKIKPLKLTRSESTDEKLALMSPSRAKSNRSIYPLAKNVIEFDAFRT